MNWFQYLKENGHFDPSKNPSPIKTDNGYQIPYWSVLDYLGKLAGSISKGENIDLAPELIEIIRNVSEHPVDNYHTWYHFIKIISILPNELISSELLNYIPVWTTSQFDTMLQTQEICSKLLPKFVTDASSESDREKAEIILCHLFDLKNNEDVNLGDGHGTSQYISPIYLYFLSHDLLEDNLLGRIVKQSGYKPILKLMDSINLLLRDVPVNAQERDGEKVYTFELYRNFNTLTIKIVVDDNGTQKIEEKTVDDYLEYSHEQLNDLLNNIYRTYSISKEIAEKINARLRFNLENDMISAFGYNGIRDLDEDRYSGFNEALNTFSLILREWLTLLAKGQNIKKIEGLLQILKFENRYQLPFFVRMKLYTIAQNWPKLKNWFIELIIGYDKKGLFSDNVYKLELYYLLSAISGNLQPEEADIIKNILNQGPITREFYDPLPEYWRHRWLDALKDQPEFRDDYKSLQEKLKVKSNYAEEGKITVRVGNISPYSKEQILAMPIGTLVKTINTYENNDRWEDPTIDGLADEFCSAIEEQPQHFIPVLTGLQNAKYIYVYRLLSGFSKAAKNKKEFEWKPLLEFIENYINADGFISGNLSTEEGLNVNPDWIYGNIASLISDGSHDNTGSYEADEYLQVKSILLKLESLVVSKWGEKLLDDYVTSSINTTPGRVLQALIMYSLKVARSSKRKTKRWDIDLRRCYTRSLENSEMEAFTFLAMYLRQLMYLDKQWLDNQLRKVKDHDNLCIAAFMDGLAFTNPLSKDYYKIIYPLYEEFCLDTVALNRRNLTLINHFVAYYIWDYENKTDQALIIKLLNSHPGANVISRIITALSRLRKELPLEQDDVEKILNLWKIINAEIKVHTDKESKKMLSNVVYMNELLTKIDEDTIDLVEDNIEVISSSSNLYRFIDNLLFWSETTEPKYIARLMQKIKFDSYFDQEKTRRLIEFLYLNGIIDVANEITNRISMMGYDNLRDLYERYKIE